jgi:hypothetical protein
MGEKRFTAGGFTELPDPPKFMEVGGIVHIVLARAPVDGVDGANICGPASTCYRTDVGNVGQYINTGTLASPAWKAITHA